VTALAALLAAGAVVLCFPAVPRLTTKRSRTLSGTRWLSVVPAVAGCVVVLHGRHLALALVVLGAGSAAFGLWSRGRGRAAADRRRQVVIEACEALASELRAGQPSLVALERTVEVWPDLAPVAAACRLDADVPTALRRLATTPGAEALVEVAATWQLSQQLGAGLAVALDRVVDTARGQLSTRRLVAGELASAQATARMVAVMPVVLLVLSNGLGSGAWHFLAGTTPGVICLAAGVSLALAGMWWIDRIVGNIERGAA
jgi:tight adherence protein B